MADNSQARFHVLRAGRYLITLVIVGLAIHIFLPQFGTLEHTFQVVRQMAWWAVVMALIAQVCSYLGGGYLVRAIVKLSDKTISVVKAALIMMAAYSLGMAAGGMVGSAAATYRWLQKVGVRSEVASMASALPAFFITSVLILVSFTGLIHLLLVHQLSDLQGYSFSFIFLSLLASIGLLAWGYRHQRHLIELTHRLGDRWARLRHRSYNPVHTDSWFAGLFEAWDLMIKGGWRGPVLGAVLWVLFDMLTLNFLFIAAGYPVSPGILLTGYGLPLLIGRMAFFIPGGIGVVEATMVALYNSLGVPNEVSVVVVLTYRFISFWLPLFIGFPLIGVVERNSGSDLNQQPIP